MGSAGDYLQVKVVLKLAALLPHLLCASLASGCFPAKMCVSCWNRNIKLGNTHPDKHNNELSFGWGETPTNGIFLQF